MILPLFCSESWKIKSFCSLCTATPHASGQKATPKSSSGQKKKKLERNDEDDSEGTPRVKGLEVRFRDICVTVRTRALLMLKKSIILFIGCVDAVLRLLGVFHDVLYGDVAPVRPGSTLGVVSVRLSRSLFVPGRQLKKGGSPPFPPLLAPTPGWPPRGGLVSAPQLPTPGWPPRGGLVSAPQLPTPGWPLRERRETPPRQCVFFFFFFFFLFLILFISCKFGFYIYLRQKMIGPV